MALLVTTIVTTLVGLAVVLFSGRWWGSIIVLGSLSALAAVLLLAVFPAISRPPPELEAIVWKQRHDDAQRNLRIAEEKQRVAQAHADRFQSAAEQLVMANKQVQSELAQEKQAHADTHRLLAGEQEKALDALRKAAEDAEKEARQTTAQMKMATDQLRSRIERIHAALASEREAHAKTRDDLTTATKAVADLKKELARMESERRGLLMDLRSADDRVATLTATLSDAQRRIAELERAPRPTLAELKTTLQRGIAAPSYDIRSLADAQIVVGRVGTYYTLTLKAPAPDGAEPKPFEFLTGQYRLTSGDAVFLDSFNRVVEDVIVKIHGRVPYEVFVRAGADEREFKVSPSAAAHEDFRVVQYLPKQTSTISRYLNVSHEQRLGRVLRNADLPNLRAAYVARLIRGHLAQLIAGGPSSEVTILQEVPKGPPRNVSPELFLLINW